VSNLVVADFIPSVYVSEFKSVVVEAKNLIFFNTMEGADIALIREYPGIFSRIECSTKNLKETIDVISFKEKSIEVRGKSKKFRCIGYGKVDESLETKALVYNQSSIVQGLVTEDMVRNIHEFVEEYSISENRGDSYRKCKAYLSQVCKEYLYYSVLNFVKTVSEKSCLYLMDNTHLLDRGEEVGDFLRDNTDFYSHVYDGVKIEDYSNLVRNPILKREQRDSFKPDAPSHVVSFIRELGDRYIPVDSPFDSDI